MKKKIVGILICVFFIGISIPQTGLFETVKADPGDVILSFNSPGQYPFGLAWDGQHLWNTNYDLTEKGTYPDNKNHTSDKQDRMQANGIFLY